MTRLTPEEDFAAAKVMHPTMDDAPRLDRDSPVIVVRDNANECWHVRWRTHPDLEEGERPYWACCATDVAVDAVMWAQSTLSQDELYDAYCT
jgi:hypothetical protein